MFLIVEQNVREKEQAADSERIIGNRHAELDSASNR